MIPHINGFEVCKSLRENGETTPVLMLTARDAVRNRIEGLLQARNLPSTSALLWQKHPPRAKA